MTDPETHDIDLNIELGADADLTRTFRNTLDAELKELPLNVTVKVEPAKFINTNDAITVNVRATLKLYGDVLLDDFALAMANDRHDYIAAHARKLGRDLRAKWDEETGRTELRAELRVVTNKLSTALAGNEADRDDLIIDCINDLARLAR